MFGLRAGSPMVDKQREFVRLVSQVLAPLRCVGVGVSIARSEHWWKNGGGVVHNGVTRVPWAGHAQNVRADRVAATLLLASTTPTGARVRAGC